MKLRDRAAKVHGPGAHRERASERTFEEVRPYLRRLGITRVADVTGLDRIGIPVYNAIVPRANDDICVYHGKGVTRADARTSAVMEAVERFAGGLPLAPTTIASYEELLAEGRVVLRPSDLNIAMLPQYRDDLAIYWVTGHDLLNDEPVLVPHSGVCYTAFPGAPPCYELTTSNGLASGNSLEEAVCHALCELIERDGQTIAEVAGDRLGHVLAGAAPPRQAARPDASYPHLLPASVPPRVQPLVERFHDAGVELQLRWITSDLGIPTVLASACGDPSSAASDHDHIGLGAHPDVEIALIRAITECAQSRAVDRHPMFQDRLAGTGGGQRRPRFESAGRMIEVGELPSYPSDDVVADIRFMLARLRACGLARAIVVDLSPPEIPAQVVRALVPGLESWATDGSRLGARATRTWNQTMRAALDGQAPHAEPLEVN